MTSGNAHAVPERSSEGKRPEEEEDLARSGCPGVGDADAGMPAAGVAGSSPARIPEPIPPAGGGGARWPGAAGACRFHSIGIDHATSTDDSREYWRNRLPGGCHHALDGAHARPGHGLPGTAASHLVGGEGLCQL